MAKALRPDLVFSDWIFIWFILYAFKFVTFSPKFGLILGLLNNTIMLILMLLYGKSFRTMVFFVIINIFIKIAPLYYLRNERIKWRDIYFTFGLFFLYIIWLHINRQSLIGNLKLVYKSLIYGLDKTPVMAFIKNF